jgi:hypothetical protein
MIRKIIILLIAALFFSCFNEPEPRKYYQEANCPKCYGNRICMNCFGTGYITDRNKNPEKCFSCNGNGKCIVCGGTGKIKI